MNLRQDLQAWDDSVGEKVAALALAAEQGFEESAERMQLLTERILETAGKRPAASEHPVPERLNPPQKQGGEPL